MKVVNITDRPRTLVDGRVVEPGDAVEVDAKTGKAMTKQPDVWARQPAADHDRKD